MIKPARALALLALLAFAQAASAATAREMYAAALARQRQLRTLPESRATLASYRSVVEAFEAVVRRHPGSGYADNALWEAARVAGEAAEHFGSDRERQRAVRLLTLLTTDYGSSTLGPRAREELKRLSAAPAAKASPKPVPATPARDTGPREGGEAAAADGPAARPPLNVLRDVRRSVTGDVVRVSIELAEEAVYRSERIENPPRVLFDLASVRLGPAMPEGSLSYPGDIVRHIRIGRHPNQVVRVVVDLEGVKRYSVFTLYQPYRIVVDCERESVAPVVTEVIREEPVKLAPPPPPDPPPPLDSRRVRGFRLAATIAPGVIPPPPLMLAAAPPPSARAPAPPLAVLRPPLRPTRSFAPRRTRLVTAPTVVVPPGVPRPAAPVPPEGQPAPPPPSPTPGVAVQAAVAERGRPAARVSEIATPPERPAPPPPAPAAPAATPKGNYSLSRQLGLGAARIVIDPGHGGHDPGAEGGGGAFEAALVLDIALRLERLLAASGSEVVLTRRTDAFVPLEERTVIANQARGDLFLSIHANASRNRKASGVETYVLNFATTPDAEAVAARENASTGRTMSSLNEIVRAITLNNKLDESRTFAALVQHQMVEHLKGSNRSLRDHGVKQAPFVVLIGASMPSVLVEVSFITNSVEGRLLRSGAYRQKIAEALVDAVHGYQKSLKGAVVVTQH